MEELKTEELIETTASLADAPKQMNLNDLKVGYFVGMNKEGNFVFDIFGTERGLAELLGLHEHASRKIETIYSSTQFTGDAITHEVGKAVAMLNQKLDRLLAVVAPQKPDNKI